MTSVLSMCVTVCHCLDFFINKITLEFQISTTTINDETMTNKERGLLPFSEASIPSIQNSKNVDYRCYCLNLKIICQIVVLFWMNLNLSFLLQSEPSYNGLSPETDGWSSRTRGSKSRNTVSRQDVGTYLQRQHQWRMPHKQNYSTLYREQNCTHVNYFNKRL